MESICWSCFFLFRRDPGTHHMVLWNGKKQSEEVIKKQKWRRHTLIIQQIRNATVKVTYGGITFLIDPWFQDKGTGFSANAIRPEMQGVKSPLHDLPDTPEQILKSVEFCLVTHVHPDHVTKDYMPDEMRMIAQNEMDAEKLRKMGFQNVEGFSDTAMSIGQVTIQRVDGLHGDTQEADRRMGPVSGFVLESKSEVPLYIAGIRSIMREYGRPARVSFPASL